MKLNVFVWFSLLSLNSVFAQKNTFTHYDTRVIGFVENIGQVRDHLGNTNKNVRFLFTNGTFHLALNENGFSAEFLRIIQQPGMSESIGNGEESPTNYEVASHRVDIILKGMNKNASVEGTAFTEVTVNCYQNILPRPGFVGARVFAEVTYKNVYPFIDMVFRYDEGKKLTYEFVLHPGADPKDIRMEYLGTSGLFLNNNKEVEFFTSNGFLKQTAPVTYRLSDHTIIPSSFQLNGKMVGFNLNKQDIKDETVVIDPTLIWGSFYGGPEEDMAAEVGICTDGKVAMTGHTISTTFIASAGAYQTFYAGGGNDLFLALFKSNGKMEWATYFGGPGEDVCFGVAIDTFASPDAIIMCGNTISDTMVTTDGAHQTTIGGFGDILLTKFSSSGALVWSTYMGGSFPEHARSAVCDPSGNIYITGTTKSSQGIAMPGAYETVYQGGEGDSYLTKFSPDCVRLWSTYLGGNKDERCHGICLDDYGNVLVHGTTESDSGLVSPGTYQSIYGGNIDAFFAKFSINGNFDWCSYFGGAGEDHGRSITTDEAGNIYICGYTFSETAIATPGAFQEQWVPGYNSGNDPLYDAYLSKFTSLGEIIWSTYYGYDENDIANSVVIDTNQKVYLIGKTRSDTTIATPDGFQPLLAGGQDAMFVKFDESGNRIWGSYLGAAFDDAINNGRLGPNARLYFALDTDGQLPVTTGVYQTEAKGSGEVAVFVFDIGEACYDDYEPNESLAAAEELAPYEDTTFYGYSGSIASGTDADWYLMKIPDTNLKVELSKLVNDYDLNLYQKDGQLLFSSVNSGAQTETIIYNSAPQDTFYLEIAHDASEYNLNDCYRLRIMTKDTPWDIATGFGNDPKQNISLNLYPNPASHVLKVEYAGKINENTTIILCDIFGHEYYRASSQDHSLSIPVNNLPNGIYFVQVQSQNGHEQRKVIVQH